MVAVQSIRQGWQPMMRRAGVHALAGGLYLLLSLWAAEFAFEPSGVPLIWPATGLALAMIWRFGYTLVGTIFVVSTLAHLLLSNPLLGAALLGVGNTASACLGAWLLRRLGFRGDLASTAELLRLFGVGVGVTALFSGIAGALVLAGLGEDLPKAMMLCWFADGMGVVLFAPLLTSLALRGMRPADLALAGAALVMAPALTLVIYSEWIPEQVALPLSYAIFPLILLVALRCRPWVVAAAVTLSGVVALQCTADGKGPFAGAGMGPDILALHAQLALLAVTGLFLAAVRQERVAADERARAHLQTLARAGRINAKPFDDEQLIEKVGNGLEIDRTVRAEAADRAAVEARLERLTPRERQVMEGMLRGRLNKLIADDLDVSVRTVEVHRAHVLDKLEARNSSDMVRLVLSTDAYRDWLL